MTPSLVAYAVRSLERRAARSLAVLGGLTFAVALVAAVVFLLDALRAETERTREAAPELVVSRLVGGRPALVDAAAAGRLAAVPGVRAARARVWGYVFVPALPGNVTVIGRAPGAPALDVAAGTLAEGREPGADAHEMLVGAGVARALGVRVGDRLALPSLAGPPIALRVVGAFTSASDLYTADVVVCDDADARALLGLGPAEATDVAVELSNPAEARVVAREAQLLVRGARVVERDQMARIQHLAYGRRAGLVLAACLPALLALFALAWDRVSGLGPAERREVAILKAVGWSTADVLKEKLLEALLLGSVAVALGLGLAYVWDFVLGAPGLRPALVGWTTLYPEAALTPAVDAGTVAAVGLAVLGPFALLSVVPAWNAARTDPLDVLRGG